MSASAAYPNKSSFHWRNNSGELDVFEAAGYFSNALDPAHINGVRHHISRRSLDVPAMMRSNPIPHHHYIIDRKQLMKDDNKKMKQPSSPGGRLASFLNSIFNQTSAKKKKKPKSNAAKELEEEEKSPSGRRKRRSSISHFRITTPAASANTPTKPYRELARLAEHNAVSVVEKKGVSEKIISEKVRSWEKKKGREEEDDGGESDSSSDLFDLPIKHDVDFFPAGLPVYGTTRIHTITIPTPIPSASYI